MVFAADAIHSIEAQLLHTQQNLGSQPYSVKSSENDGEY